jgi:hypothetical protein
VGKSTASYEAAEEIASRLGRKLLPLRLRWRGGKWVIDDDNNVDIFEVLGHPEDYFVLVDVRLATIEPVDLMGKPVSRQQVMFYEPLVWAVLLSTCPGVLLLDEFTQKACEDRLHACELTAPTWSRQATSSSSTT